MWRKWICLVVLSCLLLTACSSNNEVEGDKSRSTKVKEQGTQSTDNNKNAESNTSIKPTIIDDGSIVDNKLFNHKPTTEKAATVNIDANSVVRTIHNLQFGLNIAYTSRAQDPIQRAALKELGPMSYRYPSGLLTDIFHWETNSIEDNIKQCETSWEDFVKVCEEVGVAFDKIQIGVNYGTGTVQEAARWVKDANITKKLGIKYWEIGNETWYKPEPDKHGSTLKDGTQLPGSPHDPVTYGQEAVKFI